MKFRYLILIAILFVCSYAKGQNTQTEFGKNVVQYKDFDWAYYQMPFYDVYFYDSGREPARYVVEKSEKYLREVEKKLDYPLGEKVSFIVYNSYSDFRQSNFRLNEEIYNVGGTTPLAGNKSFIYFNGNHLDFDRQIKAGFAKLVLSELMSGGNLQQKVQSSVLLNIPEWCMDGIIRELSEEWTPYQDNKLKEGIISEKFKKFKTLDEEEMSLAGFSLWKYIYDQYGEEAFAATIYNMHLEHGMEGAFNFVLGKGFSEIYDEWYEYNFKRFTARPKTEAVSFEEIKPGKVLKRGELSRWDLSGSGGKAAFVTNDRGKIKVWVENLADHKKKCVFKSGYRRKGEIDYNYPVIAWNPTRDILTVFFEKRAEPYYFNYNANTGEREEDQVISNVDYVLDASYSQDGRMMVASAMKNGQSDIYIFDQRTQFFRPLTDDIYDDRQPRFINESKGIVFSSDRPDQKLNKVTTDGDYSFNTNYDIFYFPDYMARPRTLKRITKTKYNEWQPDHYDTAYISYLTDENGILNRNAAHYDSVFNYIRVVAQYKDTAHFYDTFKFYKNDIHAVKISNSVLENPGLLRIDTDFIYKDTVRTYAITDHNDNILSYRVLPRNRSVYDLFRYDGNYRLFKNPTPVNAEFYNKPRSSLPIKPLIKDTSLRFNSQDRILINIPDTSVTKKSDTLSKKGAREVVSEQYFQTDFPASGQENKKDSVNGKPGEENRASLFKKREKKKNKFASEALYFLAFSPDLFVIQADNSILTTPYLPYTPGTPLIFNPTINGVFKLAISDLFKDYRLIGGMGIRPDLTGADYFMTFENNKKRLDKRFIFYRKGQTQQTGDNLYTRTTSAEGRAELRWPFSEVMSLRGSIFSRQDRTVYLTSDVPSLEKPDDMKFWGGSRAELVFDNTIDRGMNLRTGSRFKVYSEFYDAVNLKGTSFAVVGADFRTYTKIHRQIIWANRIAYGSSFGSAKVVYFLGGSDGWLLPRTTDNAPDPNQNYTYMLEPGSLRGFNQNARNGNSFALYNSEIRMPVFKYLLNRALRSQFLENLQAVTFFDAGSAWLGFLPTGENNAYATRYIYNQPLVISVVTNRDPFVFGYGFGFRTTLLGYFIRWDYAWGVEENEIKAPINYFSLGMDF